ncbi:LytR/AlgR family response regulator transcription factor [Olivibacter sitiensis]|uniref:LytR/AlgR family response regulator transcription factor n=1 Tax=Olivibacter sitiensis TaxID=376470 RepID=UPI0004867312|nr:LytTR family DNA-binding domain-containing protein [Olivibacter sitiensis]
MIKAVILDDEERGAKLLLHKLNLVESQLEVMAIYTSSIEALNPLRELSIDVLFLDVEMPVLNGFQFLQALGTFQFEVIFVTAYDAYTLHALRINALDYLLKPVDIEELRGSIERLKQRLQSKTKVGNTPHLPERQRIALPTMEGIHLIKKDDIIRVEAMSNYSVFYLSDDRKIVVSKTLKDYEQLLGNDVLIRVNRSVIVNLDHVVKYRKGDGGTLVLTDSMEVEVSTAKKSLLLERLFG